jgi:hypothetical protein
MRMMDLKPGWAVLANDGRRLGTVKEVGQNYVLTSQPGFAGDLYVPASAIGNVDQEVVQLNVPLRDAQRRGWEQPPRDDDALETKPETDLHRHV